MNQVIGRGSFVSRVSEDLQLAFSADVCGGLGALQSILKVCQKAGSTNKINFALVSDFKSALHVFDSNYRVVTMTAKLSNIVRETLAIKKECISVLMKVKVDAHKDDVKQWRKLPL